MVKRRGEYFSTVWNPGFSPVTFRYIDEQKQRNFWYHWNLALYEMDTAPTCKISHAIAWNFVWGHLRTAFLLINIPSRLCFQILLQNKTAKHQNSTGWYASLRCTPTKIAWNFALVMAPLVHYTSTSMSYFRQVSLSIITSLASTTTTQRCHETGVSFHYPIEVYLLMQSVKISSAGRQQFALFCCPQLSSSVPVSLIYEMKWDDLCKLTKFLPS